jgi:hypothetical protein
MLKSGMIIKGYLTFVGVFIDVYNYLKLWRWVGYCHRWELNKQVIETFASFVPVNGRPTPDFLVGIKAKSSDACRAKNAISEQLKWHFS